MQPVSDLEKLHRALNGRTRRLRLGYSALSSPMTAQGRQYMAFLTIELDNLLVMGLRQFAKSVLIGCRTKAGNPAKCSQIASSPSEAGALMLSVLNNRKFKQLGSPATVQERDEFTFREPRDLYKLMLTYSATNIQSVLSAMAFNGNVFSEIATLRNFFAHRAEGTFDKVRGLGARIGIIGFSDPESLLLEFRPNTNIRLIEGWMNDIDDFFDEVVL
jgi:hypothetical protein